MTSGEAGLVDAARRRAQPTDRFGRLLVLLLVSFMLTGVEDDPLVRAMAAVVNGLVLVGAFRSTGRAATFGRLAAVIAVSLTTLAVIAVSQAEDRFGGVAALMQAVILLAIALAIAGRVIAHRHVGLQTILGAICIYVLLGLMFGWVYFAMQGFYDDPVLLANDGSADPMYYSFVTLTTVGFGDIVTPLSLVRRVTTIEAMMGQIFLATMVARLVSLYGSKRGDADETD